MKLSIITPVYVNRKRQIPYDALGHYNSIGETHPLVEVILVDDGSPIKINYSDYPFIKFFRIPYDKPWNQPEASNVGVKLSTSEYIFHCNIDHLIPGKLIVAILAGTLPRQGEVFRFPRTYHGELLSPNKNIYLMTKLTFQPGYDLDFCGNYGYDDTYFFDSKHVRGIEINTPIDVVQSTSHDLKRGTSINKKLYDEKMKNLKHQISHCIGKR